jgi:hypothetical protein
MRRTTSKTSGDEDDYSQKEIVRRRDEALRRALNTPSQPKRKQKPTPSAPLSMGGVGKKPQRKKK